ncbi:MAG: hypothetical protein U1U88_001967, partial [Lawsonella clevelandensis]
PPPVSPASLHGLADDNNFKLHQEFVAETVKRGALMASHHNHFTNLAETQEDVDKTIKICDEALSVVASATRIWASPPNPFLVLETTKNPRATAGFF